MIASPWIQFCSGRDDTSSRTAQSGSAKSRWLRSSAVPGCSLRRSLRSRIRWLPKKPHFPPKAKSVIYLFMAGAPEPARTVRLQAEAAGTRRPADPGVVHRGQAVRLHGHVLQGSAQAAGHAPEVHAARPVRRLGLGVLPHIATVVDDTRDSALGQDRSLQSRAGEAVRQHRLARSSAGRAWAPGSPTGSAASRRICPASSCCSPGRAGRAAGAANWGSGFLPTAYQGVPFRSGGDPILNLSSPAGIDRRAQSQTPSRPLRDLNRLAWPKPAIPEIATRIAAYEMAYRMQTSAPELIDLSEESKGDARAVRRRAGQELVRQQLPAGAPAGGARRALRAALSHRLGPSRRPRTGPRRQPGQGLPGSRPARCGAGHGPEAARPARQHAGDLGRRIRPHADGREARDASAAIITSTPTPCGWPAAASSRASRSAAPTNSASQPAEDRVHVHDLQATILHLLGLDHTS